MASALLQLRLTLDDAKPPIWRRLFVTNQITLRHLHEVMQAVAGWENKHPHEFVIAERRYGEPSPHEVVPVQNETLFRLHSLPLTEGTSFTYVYDFRDHWRIEAKVEAVLEPETGAAPAFVTEGARAFPLEDSGGVSGYEDLVSALRDPAHPKHEEYRHWTGTEFDPERFDRKETNERLKRLE